jgi:SAM-dependent methyltransferase
MRKGKPERNGTAETLDPQFDAPPESSVSPPHHSSFIISHSSPSSPLSYRSLAPHYDAIMAHVDYPGWARHLRGLWRSVRGRGRTPSRLLEIAAGTCRLASPPLFPEAFSVHTDLSHQMLHEAARGGGVGANNYLPSPPHRAACDARALPFRDGSFDLVLMIYDSLNYLTRPEQVRRAFDEAFRALAPGGVFLFDVTTAACSKRWFADTLDVQETEAGTSVRHSRYDAPTRIQLNLFTFFTLGPDGRYDRTEEVHRQRVWPSAFLKKTAREAGFSVRACLADFTLKPGNDRHERLHFVLQRP